MSRSTSASSFPSAAAAVLVFANLAVLDAAGGPLRQSPTVGVFELGLALVAVAAAARTLGLSAWDFARRGVLEQNALALLGALGALLYGALNLVHEGHEPSRALASIGFRPGPCAAWFTAAAAIASAALAASCAGGALGGYARRRLMDRLPLAAAALDTEVRWVLARVARAATNPPEDSWDDIVTRALFTGALGCASFAMVTHGCFGGGPLGSGAVAAGIAVLVVASASAVRVAGPAARSMAVLAARRAGVLVRDPAALVSLASAEVACLEKNGILTAGELSVRRLSWAPGVTPDKSLLADVASLEQVATHPAGRTIAAWLAKMGVKPLPPGSSARVIEFHDGIAGRLRDALVAVGAPSRWHGHSIDAPPEATVAVFGRNGVVYGWFELHASVHPQALAAVLGLGARGVRSQVLSGDRHEATVCAAQRLAIPGTGGLSPRDKALSIRALQLSGARVLMVGDASQDPDVAAQADVAVAVAPATLPGRVRASIVMCHGRIDELAWLVDLGRTLRSVLWQNTAFSAAYNAALIPAAALGYVSPALAAGLSVLEALVGLANAVRLLSKRARRGT